MSENKSISSDALLEKREAQLRAVSSIVEDVNNLQQALNTRREQLTINQGALLQLNALLEDLGVELPDETSVGVAGTDDVVAEGTETVDVSDAVVTASSDDEVEEVDEL